MKIAIVGTSGSGKSTLAGQVARLLNVPHVELDALYHRANWTHVAEDELRALVDAALDGDGWVVDGNYSIVRDLTWGSSDIIVWLDYPRWFVMQRMIRRTLRRALFRTELWHGNRERPLTWLKPVAYENIVLWAWTTHGPNRAKYEEAFADPRWAGRRLIRLRSARETRQFLEGLVTDS